jgi:outer membrane protein assembly factor BamB
LASSRNTRGLTSGSPKTWPAATGDRLWRFEASSAIHGAPSVVNGIVYFAACPRCGSVASRYAKQGDRGTYGLNARTGKLMWHWPDGVFSPVVADSFATRVKRASPCFSRMSARISSAVALILECRKGAFWRVA